MSLRIGVTGGIGSGKTTVANLFAAHGIAVIDADEIARRLTARGQTAFDDIVARFGNYILTPDGEIDRARLRARVFANVSERRQLEAILHPRIREQLQTAAAHAATPYCLLVIPLLTEKGLRMLVDRVLVVETDPQTQLARVMRRGIDEDQAREMLAAQASNAERRAIADDLIVNNGGRATLAPEVARLHEIYLRLAATGARGV